METLTFHKGWAIRWSGWRYLGQQNLCVGWWIAAREGTVYYSTTHGNIEWMKYGPCQMLELDVQRGWGTREQPDDLLKRDALNHLKHYLDTGKTWAQMGPPSA